MKIVERAGWRPWWKRPRALASLVVVAIFVLLMRDGSSFADFALSPNFRVFAWLEYQSDEGWLAGASGWQREARVVCWQVGLPGRRTVLLTRERSDTSIYHCRIGGWSPDSKRLLVLDAGAVRDSCAHGAAYVEVDLDGQERQVLGPNSYRVMAGTGTDDWYRLKFKGYAVDGRVVLFRPTLSWPNRTLAACSFLVTPGLDRAEVITESPRILVDPTNEGI